MPPDDWRPSENFLNIPRVLNKTKEQREGSNSVAFQESARKEIKKLLEGLIDLTFDRGLDAIGLISLLREVSIERAIKRQSRPGQRESISRISAVTGISRAEISGLLNSQSRARLKATSHESVLNRILRGWRSDARFLTRRRPKSLELFGRVASFELLVKTYGRGLPMRAILDELICVGAIEVLSSRITLKKAFAVRDCATHKDIKSLIGQIIELFIEISGARYALETKIDSGQRRRNFKRVR